MRNILIAGFFAVSLSACASIEPEPCSAEWIEWKTDRVLSAFADENALEISRLKDFSTELADGDVGPMLALRIPSMIEAFKALAATFQDTVLPDLNAVVQQCGSTEKLVPAFTRFLEDQGVDDSILDWMDLLGALIMDE